MMDHMKIWGVKKLVIGSLLLLNAFVWPMWLGIDGWIKFIAILFIIGGVVKLAIPHPSLCPTCAPVTVKKGKKK